MSNFVSIESQENTLKLKNLFHTAIFIGFTWILFHFTVVFFFGLVLESVFLVGIFLGIGNIVAMILDIPIGVLQKYIAPKTFLKIAGGMLFLVCLIFVKFIFFQSEASAQLNGDFSAMSLMGVFLNSGLNIFLLLLAASLYGVIKESFDVTTLSYIFNISTPSEYASVISKYNIHTGIGSMVGLVFSGILLAFNIQIAIIIFAIIVVGFLGFVSKYFDNTSESIEFEDVKKIKLDVLKNDILKKKEEVVSKINTKTFIELSKTSKLVLLKPIEMKKNINFTEVYETSVTGFQTFIKIIFGLPRNLLVLWFLAVIIQYGFWDTFVSTFQVEFLNKIIGMNSETLLIKQTGGLITGYVLLGLIVIPAFLLQDFFINLSKKWGVYKIVMFGVALSSFSLFFFGIFKEIYLVILFGLINSVGYAASMPLSQAVFGGLYNEDYAKKFNLKQIDSTASAAPLKIVLNFANVVGLILGAALVGILGFDLFFIFFSFVLGGFFIFSLKNIKIFGGGASIQESTESSSSVHDTPLENKKNDPDFV